MATATQQTSFLQSPNNSNKPANNTIKSPRMRVCFSYAAYAKNLIDHLRSSCNIPTQPGLTELEFSTIQSSLHVTFPPDLRAILREGLPVGPGFPNWRSSSYQQLQLLISLPILGLCKEVRNNRFWCSSWGPKPTDPHKAIDCAKRELRKAPALIPIYNNFFIPSVPNLAGNPIFSVIGRDVKLSSFDLSGFFQERVDPSWGLGRPAWAATSARRIGVWSEMAESAAGNTGGWWSGGERRLEECMENAFARLRDGGWTEEEAREMMIMDSCDGSKNGPREPAAAAAAVEVRDGRDAVRHVRRMSLVLLRGGWRRDDVDYSLGDEGLEDEIGSRKEGRLLGNSQLNTINSFYE